MPRKKSILENEHVQAAMGQLAQSPQGQQLLGRVVDLVGQFNGIMDKIAAGELPQPQQVRGAAKVVERVVKRGPTPREVFHFGKDEVLTAEKIKARKKQLALMVHPDAGGATEEMVKINKAAEALLKEVKP